MRRSLPLLCMLALAACGSEQKSSESAAAASPVEAGKIVFQQNCTTCHLLKTDIAAPALAGALDRWGGDSARLKAFIRNPQKAIADGDPQAVKVYERWKPAMMTAYPQLSDADLNALIAYFQGGE